MISLVFPGQGAQREGMGRELFAAYPEAREVFEAADEALGFSITRLCLEGPDEQLQLTANAQPAILTTTVAVLRVAQARLGLSADVVAGHSLGEYSALVYAGVLQFEDAVRLVNKRGQFMQRAVPVGRGAMAAILGLDADEVRALCEEAAEGQVLSPANFNSPTQTVVAGHREAVHRATALLEGRRGRARLLDVSAPFHCALMEPAARELEAELAAVEFADASVDVICNVDAQATRSGDAIRSLLVQQVTQPVKWTQCVQKMEQMGVKELIELGPGQTLSRLSRQIARGIEPRSIEQPHELEPDKWERDERRTVYKPSGLTLWSDGMVWDPDEPGAYGL